MDNSIEISAIILGCLLVGALVGMGLRSIIPQHHLDSDTRDLIKLGVGLIGTMSALVLGLLVASTKGSYDTKRSELAQMAGNVIVLDRVLAHYGPEAGDVRAALRSTVAEILGNGGKGHLERFNQAAPVGGEVIFEKIQNLVPQTDAQRTLQAQAKSLSVELSQMRWLLYAQSGTSISTPFLVIVAFWLTVLYVSFGLFAPRNATAVTTLVISALSVGAAMFLILDLDHPFNGFMRIPVTPVQNALAAIGSQ